MRFQSLTRCSTHALLLLAVFLSSGCEEQSGGRVPIQGTVTLDGEEVSIGSISLRPAAGHAGPAAGTDILDGEYSIPAKTGPATGAYLARITIVSRNAASDRLAGKGGYAKTFDLPVEIEAVTEVYDFSLPPKRK